MRTVPVHRSLHRRILLLGGERDLVQIAASITMVVGFGGMTPIAATCAGVFWFASLYGLQRMAKADHHMSQIFERHVRQQDFYAARSTPWRVK